jgi:hypothetical protein
LNSITLPTWICFREGQFVRPLADSPMSARVFFFIRCCWMWIVCFCVGVIKCDVDARALRLWSTLLNLPQTVNLFP